MAALRLYLALVLSLLFGTAAARAADPAAEPGLYDRPVLVVDPGMHTAIIRRAAADQEGRWVVTGSLDKTVRVWSLADGALQRTIRLPTGPGNVGQVRAVAISPDGALIAAGGWTRFSDADPQEQIYLFDRDTGTLVQRIEGLPSDVLHLAFSPDGERLAAVLGYGGLRIYSRQTSWAEVARDEHYGDGSYGADFAPDGRLATTSDDGKVRLYAGDLRGTLEPTGVIEVAGDPFGIAFSPDGTRLAVGYEDAPQVDLLDAHTLAPLLRPDLAGIDNGDLSKVAWSRDGATLFAAGRYGPPDNSPVLAWAGGGAGARRVLLAGANTVMSLVPLPGGDLVVASTDPWLARLAPDGTPRWRHGPPTADLHNQFDRLSVSNDGSRVGFGFHQFGASPARFDLATRLLVLAPTDDSGMAVPRQTGLPIEHWLNEDHPTLGGKELPLDQYERSRSLAVHPHGDRFVLGTDWSLRAFDTQGTQLWRRAVPGVVWAVNITGDGRLVVAAYGDGTIRWHRMTDGEVLLAFLPLADRKNWVMWTPEGFFSASEGARGVLRWHVNRGWDAAADSVPVDHTTDFERPSLPIRVLQTADTMLALGLDTYANARQSAKLVLHTVSGPGGKLHVLAIGISQYNPKTAKGLKLDYADRDAGDFLAKIQRTQSGITDIDPQVLPNEDADRKTILKALATVRDHMAQGEGKDTAVVLFSGHGAILGGHLFLLPYDVDNRSEDDVKATAVRIDEFTDALGEIAQRGKVLVLIDACHSGAATADHIPLVMNATQLLQVLARQQIAVVTSSRGDETSREDAAYGEHGAFTKVILDAFSAREADIDGDGVLSTLGLANYVSHHVTDLNPTQHPEMELHTPFKVFVMGQ